MVRRFPLFALLLILTGCEGILDGIYDEAPSDDTFSEGFHRGTADNSFVLQLDASGYEEWIYVDLHRKTIQRMPIPRTLTGEWDGRSGITYQLVEGSKYTELGMTPTDPQPEPQEWDMAIHHFDVRTNGGRVAVAGTDRFVADTWTDNQVIVDLKEMMALRIGYENSYVNPVLTSWVTMDISTPPPVYTASGDTYVMELKDGTRAELYLKSYVSPRGTKGYLTIEIKYPL